MSKIIDKNKSYTKKDFNSIYSELLDLIPTLTTKWNTTNEADPGVVLVKLMSVLGDKLNYSIDKNALELLPSSVTQKKNARQIFNLVGYKMGWYNSALAEIGFKLNDIPPTNVFIKKYTALSSLDGASNYVTLDDLTLYRDVIGDYQSQNVRVIEGFLNRQEGISISDLDEDFCFVFPSINIAENGIFVYDHSSTFSEWTLVDNISSEPVNSKVFELIVNDTESQCKIKFPSNISELLTNSAESKIDILYITSNGLDGNILENTLTTFVNGITAEDGTDLSAFVNIVQTSPIQNGSNPETIDEAYQSSRFIVNTFDTLITKQDYYNFLRTLKVNNSLLVSNAIVSDRSDDINETHDLVTLVKLVDTTVKSTGTLTPFDVCIYLLQNSADYKKSYNLILNETIRSLIERKIDESKAINVNINLPSTATGTNYIFKAYFDISGQIVTNEKISQAESNELIEKIIDGLKLKYSSKTLEFGEQIEYAEIVDEILRLDSRVKTAIINQPTFIIRKVSSVDETLDETEMTATDKEDLVIKMIAAGKIPFYKLDKDFDLPLGTVGSTLPSVSSVDSYLELNIQPQNTYILKQGEVVTLSAPQYVNSAQYTSGVRVTFWSTSSASTAYIPRDIVTALSVGEYLELSYVDSSNKTITKYLSFGDVISSSIDLHVNKTYVLKTTETIDVYTKNSYVIDTSHLYLSNFNRALDLGESYTLNINENLSYTNNQAKPEEIIELGSGTILRNVGNTLNNYIDISAIKTEHFVNNQFTVNGKIRIGDNNKILPGSLKIRFNQSSAIAQDNAQGEIISGYTTTINGETISIIDNGEIEYIADANGDCAYSITFNITVTDNGGQLESNDPIYLSTLSFSMSYGKSTEILNTNNYQQFLSNFEIITQNIVTLTEGCTITPYTFSNLVLDENNEYEYQLTGNASSDEYVIVTDVDSSEQENISKNIAGDFFTVRCRFDLTYLGETIKLISADENTQTVVIEHYFDESLVESGSVNYNGVSYPIVAGKRYIKTTKTVLNSLTGKSYEIYIYEEDVSGTYVKCIINIEDKIIKFNQTLSVVGGQKYEYQYLTNSSSALTIYYFSTLSDEGIEFEGNTGTTTDDIAKIYFNFNDKSRLKYYLLPISIISGKASFEISNGSSDISVECIEGISRKTDSYYVPGDYILKIPVSSLATYDFNQFVITTDGNPLIILLDKTKLQGILDEGEENYEGLETESWGLSIFESTAITKLTNLAVEKDGKTFYYNYLYKPSISELCEQPLTSEKFFDSSHVCNNHTICQYDFDNRIITNKLTVNKYSIKE